MERSLAEFLDAIKECQKCVLGRTRTNLVFGVGNPNADLMLVGEAPGYYEDQEGEPFVGAAGKLLDQLLGSVGLSRDKVYIANVLKCRPPGNRDPLPEEIETCTPYLEEQIGIIKPRVVATLGNHASRFFLKRQIYISKVHGQKFDGPGYYIFPIFHPAAALHQRTNMTALETDFQSLKDVLGEEPSVSQEQPKQMGLF